MYKGKTASGFEFEIDESALNNMELVDALAASEEDPLEVSRVVRLLLGDAQRKQLYKHLRTENGIVPVDNVVEEVKQVLRLAETPEKTNHPRRHDWAG